MSRLADSVYALCLHTPGGTVGKDQNNWFHDVNSFWDMKGDNCRENQRTNPLNVKSEGKKSEHDISRRSSRYSFRGMSSFERIYFFGPLQFLHAMFSDKSVLEMSMYQNEIAGYPQLVSHLVILKA